MLTFEYICGMICVWSNPNIYKGDVIMAIRDNCGKKISHD